MICPHLHGDLAARTTADVVEWHILARHLSVNIGEQLQLSCSIFGIWRPELRLPYSSANSDWNTDHPLAIVQGWSHLVPDTGPKRAALQGQRT